MRKLIIAGLVAIGLALGAAAPAFADEGPKPLQISVWCSADDKTAHDDLQGIVLLPDGSHGNVELRLNGDPQGGEGWRDTGDNVHIDTVLGQTAYTFHFDISGDSSQYGSYRIAGPGNTMSRVIGRDECGFRVPEAPASSLLILAGGLPVVAWVSMRRFGIRVPVRARRRSR